MLVVRFETGIGAEGFRLHQLSRIILTSRHDVLLADHLIRGPVSTPSNHCRLSHTLLLNTAVVHRDGVPLTATAPSGPRSSQTGPRTNLASAPNLNLVADSMLRSASQANPVLARFMEELARGGAGQQQRGVHARLVNFLGWEHLVGTPAPDGSIYM